VLTYVIYRPHTFRTGSRWPREGRAGVTIPQVEDVLATLDGFAGDSPRWMPMQGGLSHYVYRVEAAEKVYVLRILEPAVSLAGLGIPPEQEIENTVRAAESGAGAAVVAVLAGVPAMLLEFVPGRTLSAADLPALVGPVAAACRRLHAGPGFANPFDLGDIAAEADFDPDLTERLTAAYFGAERSPALAARVRLNLILSNVTWTLWFSVHSGLLHRDGSDFDYQAEARDKWSQAVRDLDSPELARLIDAA
jgi:hypothetical protein